MQYINSNLFFDPYDGIPSAFISNPETNPENRKTCILCLFGVISRGRAAWETIKQRIYDVLVQNGFNVKVFVYNLDIGDQLVDGVQLNHDLSYLPFDYHLESEKQPDVDVNIDAMCLNRNCGFHNYTKKQSRNALRQMYSENAVANFLAYNNADIAVVCGPDFYIANDININHIRDAMTCTCVYTSQVNPSGGYTNGFYFGKPSIVAKIMKRLELYDRSGHLHNKYNYESYVKYAFTSHKIPHKLTDIVFFKVRANGHIRWAGDKQTHFLSSSAKKLVIAEYNRISSQAPTLVETFNDENGGEDGCEFN